MIQICPNCRSTFNLIDKVDIQAPSIQEIPCPVCGQKIWKSSGWVLPKRWSAGEVIKRYPAEGAPPEPQVFGSDIPKEAQKPVWNIKLPDFSAMPEAAVSGIKTGAAVAVVLLILILIFALRRR